MNLVKNFSIKCGACGRFCVPFDEEIPFGCANPEYPEPYEPTYYCKKCFPKLKEEWLERFKKGFRMGSWQKSKAENEAAKECGLIWISSNGIGQYNTVDYKLYCYVTNEEYNRIINKKN